MRIYQTPRWTLLILFGVVAKGDDVKVGQLIMPIYSAVQYFFFEAM